MASSGSMLDSTTFSPWEMLKKRTMRNSQKSSRSKCSHQVAAKSKRNLLRISSLILTLRCLQAS